MNCVHASVIKTAAETYNDLDISCENTQAYTVMSGQASPLQSFQANEETELLEGCCTAPSMSSLKLRQIKLTILFK